MLNLFLRPFLDFFLEQGTPMTFVVTENCIKCKYTDCVDVCPVECFHEGPEMLVINPDECIDCGLCVPECPIEAIFEEDDLPEEQAYFLDINKQLATKWPIIEAMIAAPEDADDWNGMPDKIRFIETHLNDKA